MKRKQKTPTALNEKKRGRLYGNAQAPVGTVGTYRMRDGKAYCVDGRGVIRRTEWLDSPDGKRSG